jgi:hypothetical protein
MKPLVLALFSLTICGCAGAQRQYSQQYYDCMSAARTHQDVQACRAGGVGRQDATVLGETPPRQIEEYDEQRPQQPQPMAMKVPIKVNTADVEPEDPLWKATHLGSPSSRSAWELSPEDGIRYLRSLPEAAQKNVLEQEIVYHLKSHTPPSDPWYSAATAYVRSKPENFRWDIAQNAVQTYLRELDTEAQAKNELAVKMAILQQEQQQTEPAIQVLEE